MNRTLLIALTALLLPLPALSQQTFTLSPAKPSGTIVELSATASQSASNDLFRATVYAEATDANPAALARQVNQLIQQGFTAAKAQPDVKARSGGTHTYPVYGKNERIIQNWRMRSEIELESRNSAALSELIGKLQTQLVVGSLNAMPAPETASKAENEAMLAAIQQFRERAQLVSSTMGKKYRIVEINLSNVDRGVPLYRRGGRAMMVAEAAPMPVEGGESQITVTITGKIELID